MSAAGPRDGAGATSARGRESRCAAMAQAHGDSLVATAPPASRWLLVEHTGAWGRRALADSGLEPEAAQELASWAAHTLGRVLLIRRPGEGRAEAGPRRWYRVDSRPGRERIEQGWYRHDRELSELARGGSPGPRVETVTYPLYLICTHGKHDACCAMWGRPVAAALQADYPERTWECSHVGGDRFAANLVVLPHGLYYGHVPAAAATDLVARHDAGELVPAWLRGRSALHPAVQAAQHHVRLAGASTRLGSLPPVGVSSTAEEQWEVHLATEDGELVVTMREEQIELARPLTCSAAAPGSVRQFALLEITKTA